MRRHPYKRRTFGLGFVDVFGITVLIVMLALTLCTLIVSRDPAFLATAQRWMRVAAVELKALASTPRADAVVAPPGS